MAHGAIDFDDPTGAHVLETYRIVPPDVVQSHKDEARAHPRTGDRRHGSSIESGDGGRFMTNSTMGSSSGMGTIIACKSAAPFPPPAPPFASRDGERTAGAAGGNDGGSRCWEREMEGAVRPAAVAVADAPCHRRAMVLATPLAEGPARTGRSGRCRDVVSLALPPPRLLHVCGGAGPLLSLRQRLFWPGALMCNRRARRDGLWQGEPQYNRSTVN